MNYKTILMAHDFSDSGGRALERAAELARANGATLHLLHVVEYLPPVDTSFGAVSPFEVDLTDQMVESSRTRLTALGAEMGIPADRCWVEVGSPKLEVIRIAEEIEADLIVVGSHGRHGIALLLGSTASSVVHHAKCDVLAVRLPEED
jgi:universal stress protein A